MAKYRKKPIVVEANQWFPGKEVKGIKWRVLENLPGSGVEESWYVETLQGKVAIYPGDWLIDGLDGEQYPCNDKIFKQVYEKVKD